SVRDFTRVARFACNNSAIAQVTPDGTIIPKSTGQAIIQVMSGNRRKDVPVKITGAAGRPVSFANDVMPIMARAGCNSGACHGSASGKKGFKISLRGYDPAADYITLTRGTIGRRINFIEPD